MQLTDFKALTFDCYGTLIDWELGLLDVLQGWVKRKRIQVAPDRLLALFAAAETASEQEMPTAPYPDILRAVHQRIAKKLLAHARDSDCDGLANSVGKWPPFPDTVKALKKLKKTHKLAIISNVDRASFARTNRLLEVKFDAVITAEDVGAYKPDHRMFERAFEVLGGMGIERQDILHVAQSLYHDHVPAKALGLKTAWVDRRRGRAGWGATSAPGVDVQPDIVVHTLKELAEMVSSVGT